MAKKIKVKSERLHSGDLWRKAQNCDRLKCALSSLSRSNRDSGQVHITLFAIEASCTVLAGLVESE